MQYATRLAVESAKWSGRTRPMNPKNSPPSTVEALDMLLGDEILATPDNALDEVLQELGVEPHQAAEEVDTAFKAAMKARSAARLAQARRMREQEIGALMSTGPEGDMSQDELRQLLSQRLAAMPDSQRTVLHRDFKDHTVEDLRSLLRQLDALDKSNGNS
jgi:hypothetical protein